MQSIKGVVLSILILLPFASYAQIGSIGFAQTLSGSTNTGTVQNTVHRITCPVGYTLVTHGFLIRSVSGTQNYGYYYNNRWVATTSANATQSWVYNTVNEPCNSGFIDFRVNGANYYSYVTTYTGTNATTSPVNVFNQTNSQYNTFYAFFSLPLTSGSGTSSGMTAATTTVITANDQLISFVLLLTIMFMILFGTIHLLRPFYARK